MKNPIYPCLWFDGNAKQAAEFYCSVFKNSKILSDTAMVVIFELNGKKFMGLNGGAHFKFNEAVSFVIDCENQEEVDYYWNALIENGGMESMCGWLKDKFGLSWQVVPVIVSQLIGNADRKKAERAMQALMKMKKLEIQKLQDAFDGK